MRPHPSAGDAGDAASENEGSRRPLVRGERVVRVGKCRLKVSENLSDVGAAGSTGRPLRRRTAAGERRAEAALGLVEPPPDPLPASPAATTRRSAHRRREAGANSALQERPERGRGQARPSDLTGDPDAEGAAAPGSPTAVAAEDPPGPEGLALRAAVVESMERTVPVERAGRLAVRARHLLEPLDGRGPLRIIAGEEPLFAHGRRRPGNEMPMVCEFPKRGVTAGSEKSPDPEDARSSRGNSPHNRPRKFPN